MVTALAMVLVSSKTRDPLVTDVLTRVARLLWTALAVDVLPLAARETIVAICADACWASSAPVSVAESGS